MSLAQGREGTHAVPSRSLQLQSSRHWSGVGSLASESIDGVPSEVFIFCCWLPALAWEAVGIAMAVTARVVM